MMLRLKTIYSKLAFCYDASGSIADFFRLIVHTRRYARASSVSVEDPPVSYLLQLRRAESKTVMLRTYAGDIEMFYETFWRGVYNHANLNWSDFEVIVDLGAHIGMTAWYFSMQSPKATIYAVEPDPDNFELLTVNLSDEIAGSRLIPIHAAIAAGDNPVYLHKSLKSYNSHVSDKNISEISVKGMSMSKLISDMYISEIDLLKIDIEGKEEELFSGDMHWLQIVKNIVMECHSESIRMRATTILKQHGFTVFPGKNDRSYADILWGIRWAFALIRIAQRSLLINLQPCRTILRD